MNNKPWLNGIIVACYLLLNPAHADFSYSAHPPSTGALSWWQERDNLRDGSTDHAFQPRQGAQQAQQYSQRQQRSPYPSNTYAPGVDIYPAAFTSAGRNTPLSPLKCENIKQLHRTERCIMRSAANLTGLQEQIRYLNRENPQQKVATGWANVSNADLLETAEALLSHQHGQSRQSFRQSFDMYEVSSLQQANHGHFTGYFTPEIQVQSYRDHRYRYPVYGPPRHQTRLSRRQIDNGALKNRGLEIAWTDDPVNLYFAQIQGSAIARYPDGRTRHLNYAGNNDHDSKKISHYLSQRGYMSQGFSNENMRRWLHQHPDKIAEVLHSNPRYIFFELSATKPRTATGTTIIPGHTVAVDDRYIPLGSVLLAEIPRIDHRGRRTGSDWRLLFAQDRGDVIKGPGRLDLYTGSGFMAERHTYALTGAHKTYLLVRKPGWNKFSAINR